MSNAKVRLILFFTALPLLVIIVLFLPHFHHGAFVLLCAAASGIAAMELCAMFNHKGVTTSRPVSFWLGTLGSLTAYGEVSGFWESTTSPALPIGVLCLLFAGEIFKKKESDFLHALPRMAAYSLIIVYPGVFSSYAVRLIQFKSGGVLILIFLLSTFLNDSFAWLFGMLFGRNNRNILAVSPNKSLVGFVFGFLASVLVMVSSPILFPQQFPLSLGKAVLFGSVIGITTLLGDLVESVIKRSAEVKDSGSLMPGRGGLLDSIDSPLFNAPIFFFLYLWLVGS